MAADNNFKRVGEKFLIREEHAFVQFGFNWATDKESSTILIYLGQVIGLYTQRKSLIKTKWKEITQKASIRLNWGVLLN